MKKTAHRTRSEVIEDVMIEQVLKAVKVRIDSIAANIASNVNIIGSQIRPRVASDPRVAEHIKNVVSKVSEEKIESILSDTDFDELSEDFANFVYSATREALEEKSIAVGRELADKILADARAKGKTPLEDLVVERLVDMLEDEE